ncbi:MAG: hypothetical protein M0Z41_03820 [Peptococcaceae bacterium]|nr:hypothetical protein [Peptococcaceae bacterium]
MTGEEAQKMPINPFHPYSPAQDALFANRRREQSLFRRGLAAGIAPGSAGPWNIAVLGQWGIGKTSLLRRFTALARAVDSPVGIVNLSATSAFLSFNEFALVLLHRIREDLRGHTGWSGRLRDEIVRWEPTVSVGPVPGTRRNDSPGFGVEILYAELRRLWEGHLKGNLAAVIFFLDDAQNVTKVDANILLTLRAVFQDLQGLGAVFPLVVTGPEDMFESTRDLAEPVTRFFERLPLGPFSREDTREAVTVPLTAAGHSLRVEEDAVESGIAGRRRGKRARGAPFAARLRRNSRPRLCSLSPATRRRRRWRSRSRSPTCRRGS